jgi:hypothetical protein
MTVSEVPDDFVVGADGLWRLIDGQLTSPE